VSKYFVTCARGVEEITEQELLAVGATKCERVPGGVYFEGDQDALYKAHLWLRTGNRILLPLRTFPCRNPEELYENLVKFKWETFFPRELTFAVDCTISGHTIPTMAHSHYAKLKAKDAIVDRLREKTGARPNVSQDDPDLRIVLYIRNGQGTLNMDATGASLHERGYRPRGAAAPLKETLAAAILKLSGWDPATPLVDPMCGSGTLLAEAALLASNTAPGLLREKFLFMNWPDFYAPRWEACVKEAEAARRPLTVGHIRGFDVEPEALSQAEETMAALGWAEEVLLEQRFFEDFARPEGMDKGFLVMNPPYGERLGDEEELKPLYKMMGDTFKQQLKGWRAAIFTGSAPLAKSVGLRATRKIPLWNGAIECRLLTYDIF
jgi:putative N6-adenine-specific DNA methylase